MVLKTGSIIVCHIVIFLVRTVTTVEFKDITSDVFTIGHYSGLTAAFGDFNSDKLTDVFCITQGRKTLEVLLASDNKPYFESTTIVCTLNDVITSVMPGDFNGDSLMDALITTVKHPDSHINQLTILWGMHDRINCSSEIVFNVLGQPFLLDYNGDLIPDIMGEGEDSKRYVWLSNMNKTFTKIQISTNLTSVLQQFRKPAHSSAFLDLNNDLVSDIIITGENNLEQWFQNGKTFYLANTVAYPNAKVLGQSTFVDFNSDGKLDHIMPVCNDTDCKSSAVVMWHNDTSRWVTLLEDFKFQNAVWGFKQPGKILLDEPALPITLRSGDFNMDGYPDFIVVLQSKSKSESKAVIFQNIPCSNCPFGQHLEIIWNVTGLDSISNIELVTFFDIFEDGIMDILASSKIANEWHVHALQNMDTYDAYFIKVLVLSGLCYTNCPTNHIPYGTNQPGPMIRYNTTKPDGDPSVSCAVQMSQSAHFPLQLPYSVLGLGQTPNFVDHLTVAIPEMMHGKIHKREWTQIIPNSQMVVIPYPPDSERKWVKKLFVTPSHLVLLTFIALIGTCGFIAIIIALLHWKERREDKKEKMQDAYRFHFDAM